jgi:hypothetical protein
MKENRSDKTKRRRRDMHRIVTPQDNPGKSTAEFQKPKLCATCSALPAQGTTQLTWSTAFADASYTATCQALDGAAGITGLKVIRIQSIAAASITVVVQNDSGSDRTGSLHCIAIHD